MKKLVSFIARFSHALLGEEFYPLRSPAVARALNPALQSFDAWLAANAKRIPLG